MNGLSVVDGAARGRVLVVGTLPPEGRDLDVLAPAASLAAIEEALRANGFEPRRTTWARFAPLELVDVRPIDDEEMLARAVPLPGCAHVCRPDDADALRLLARSFARDRRLTASRRAAVPLTVWAAARARGDEAALAELAEALRTGTPVPVARRLAGRARRVRLAGVVTLSGLDGSGKSTQAERLREALATTGIDAAIEWNRLSHDRWLDAVARPVKRLVHRAPKAGAPSAARTTSRPGGGAARGLWVVVVALANALAHVRSVRTHTLAGRVAICDRYVLDSVVHLRAHYPAGLGQRFAVWLVRRVSPRPVAAFYLDVPPEVAYDRKPRPGALERLTRQAAAYRAECERLGVVRLDGTLPADDLAAAIAREVWRRL